MYYTLCLTDVKLEDGRTIGFYEIDREDDDDRYYEKNEFNPKWLPNIIEWFENEFKSKVISYEWEVFENEEDDDE